MLGQRSTDKLVGVDVLGNLADIPPGELQLHVKNLLLRQGPFLVLRDVSVDQPLDELLIVCRLVLLISSLCFIDLRLCFLQCQPFFFAKACFVFFTDEGLQLDVLRLGNSEPRLAKLVVMVLLSALQLTHKCEHPGVVLLSFLQHGKLLIFSLVQAVVVNEAHPGMDARLECELLRILGARQSAS